MTNNSERWREKSPKEILLHWSHSTRGLGHILLVKVGGVERKESGGYIHLGDSMIRQLRRHGQILCLDLTERCRNRDIMSSRFRMFLCYLRKPIT